MTEPRKTPRTEAVWADIPFFDPKLPAHARALEIETQELAEALEEILSHRVNEYERKQLLRFSDIACQIAVAALARHSAKQEGSK